MPVSLGSPPIASNKSVSKSMKSNKSKNTNPEILLRKRLWASGVKGYRLNWKNAPGRPDICFPGRKIAIFVNGCFWHRCPICNLPLPKTNTEFWKNKFIRNVERDKLKTQRLKNDGWKVLVVWECDIKNNLDQVVDNIKSILY